MLGFVTCFILFYAKSNLVRCEAQCCKVQPPTLASPRRYPSNPASHPPLQAVGAAVPAPEKRAQVDGVIWDGGVVIDRQAKRFMSPRTPMDVDVNNRKSSREKLTD